MREDRPVAPIGPNEHPDRIVNTLATAFQDDPAFSYILTSGATRKRVLPSFFEVMAEQSHRHGEVLASPDGGAASLWMPPGTVKDGFFQELTDTLRMIGVFKTSVFRGLSVGKQVYSMHPKPQPYVYLRYVGVAPDAQGKGWGGAVVRAGIARAAEQGHGVLLETATPGNVAIYTRLGFEITDEWQVPGGPQFWTMVHPAP